MKKLVLILIACVASIATKASTPDSVDVPSLDSLYGEDKPVLTKGKSEVPKEMESIIEAAFNIEGVRHPAATSNQKRGLAQTLNDGFEFKVRQGNRVTAFWVKKNGDQFDLIFATNGGSRASSSIPVEHYAQLTAVAGALRSPASTDLKNCKDSYVKLVVINDGKEETPVTSCLNARGKQAEQIKRFGSALVSYVR